MGSRPQAHEVESHQALVDDKMITIDVKRSSRAASGYVNVKRRKTDQKYQIFHYSESSGKQLAIPGQLFTCPLTAAIRLAIIEKELASGQRILKEPDPKHQQRAKQTGEPSPF